MGIIIMFTHQSCIVYIEWNKTFYMNSNVIEGLVCMISSLVLKYSTQKSNSNTEQDMNSNVIEGLVCMVSSLVLKYSTQKSNSNTEEDRFCFTM